MAEIRVKETGTIKLFESDNTSSVTIASPASLGADRTVTLPDGDVTLVAGTMSTSDGITTASQWRLTTSFTGDAAPNASNLEEADTFGAGVLGSSITESSGILTFPSTGFWHILFGISQAHTAESRYNGGEMYVTTDNSSYNFVGQCYQRLNEDGSGTSSSGMLNYVLDVTNTTNVKVKFHAQVLISGTTTGGSTNDNRTYATFIRLGDT